MRVAQQESATSTPRGLGLAAAAIAAGCTLALAAISAGASDAFSPPEEVPRPLALAILFGAPAVIGAIGALSGRRVLLVVAATLCLFQSVLAFSGVTLIFLVPSVVFFYAALKPNEATAPTVAPTPPAARSAASRVGRFVAVMAIGVPLTLFIVSRLGIFGILVLMLAAALAFGVDATRGSERPHLRLRDALLGLAATGLVGGAIFAFFSTTETTCWSARSTPSGLVYDRTPVNMANGGSSDIGPIGADSGIVAAGCSGGQFTLEGAALAGVLVGGAIGLAGLSAVAQPRGRPRS